MLRLKMSDVSIRSTAVTKQAYRLKKKMHFDKIITLYSVQCCTVDHSWCIYGVLTSDFQLRYN